MSLPLEDMKLESSLKLSATEMEWDHLGDSEQTFLDALNLGSDSSFVLKADESAMSKSGVPFWLVALLNPLLSHESPFEGRGPRVLVLTENRDRAMRLGRMIRDLVHNSHLRYGVITGGRPYPMQYQMLRRPMDVLIANPARLMDHIRRRRADFDRLEYVYLDMTKDWEEESRIQAKSICEHVDPAPIQHLVIVRQQGHSSFDASDIQQALQAEKTLESKVPEKMDNSIAGSEPEKPVRDNKKNRRGRSRVGGVRRRSAKTEQHQRSASPKTASPNDQVVHSASQKGKRSQSNSNRRSGKKSTGNSARRPAVHFPSDYANGGRSPLAESAKKETGLDNEPIQYLADYGYAPMRRQKKAVTVVYRNKQRRLLDKQDAAADSDYVEQAKTSHSQPVSGSSRD